MKYIRISLRFAFASALLAACSSGGGSGGKSTPKTPGQQLCESLKKQVAACGSSSSCDDALVSDCSNIVGLLSDPFIEATRSCLDAGGSASSCLASSFKGLEPTAAQKSFATTFCGQCLGGAVPGCDSLFFGNSGSVPDSLKLAGAVIMPLSDSLVSQIENECATASALTCAANFSSCAQGVLAKQAVPKDTLSCLFDGLMNGGSSASSCGDGGGLGGTGGTGTGGTGTGGTGTGGTGTGGTGTGGTGTGGTGTGGTGTGGTGTGGTGTGGTGSTHDCCIQATVPGCKDQTVESCVCAQDNYCCTDKWDANCVDEVSAKGCGTCGTTCIDLGPEPNNTPAQATLACAPKQTCTVPDCDVAGGTIDGVVQPGDTDYFYYDGVDGVCSVDPTVTTTSDGVRVCVFAKCNNNATTTFNSCTAGTKTVDGSLTGCCTSTPNTKATLDYNCPGISDSAKVTIRVDGSTSSPCSPYTVDYHF